MSPSRRRSRSLPWSSCSCCACRGSPRCRCRSVVSTPHVRLPAWRLVATIVRLPVQRKALRPTEQPCSCGVTGSWSLPLSPRDRRCCRVSPSQRRRSPRPNLVRAERGSASLVAVAMMAVLLAITAGGVYVGSAVIARHRAQAAADLAVAGGGGPARRRASTPRARRRPRWRAPCARPSPSAWSRISMSSSLWTPRWRWAAGCRSGARQCPRRTGRSA